MEEEIQPVRCVGLKSWELIVLLFCHPNSSSLLFQQCFLRVHEFLSTLNWNKPKVFVAFSRQKRGWVESLWLEVARRVFSNVRFLRTLLGLVRILSSSCRNCIFCCIRHFLRSKKLRQSRGGGASRWTFGLGNCSSASSSTSSNSVMLPVMLSS